MRWFLGLMAVVALVLGVGYAVGRFVFPNALEVSSSIVVERPRASVFAMINDLRIAQEWSPYNARDPDADYAISETPGEGQSMRWSSNVREIGRGRMSILRSIENEAVETLIEIDDRATLNSRIDLTRRDRSTQVTWSVEAECAEGWINVPCRYMNQILRSTIEGQLASGLARLKDRAEQLPPQDFEGYDIIVMPVESQAVILVDVVLTKTCTAAQAQTGCSLTPTIAERLLAEQRGAEALASSVATAGGEADRQSFIRIFPPNGQLADQRAAADGQETVERRYRFSVGFPYSGPAPVLVGARVDRTPGGATLRATIVGRRSQIPQMYQRLDAYRQAHRLSLRPGADIWEIGTPVAQPEGAEPSDPVERTEIYYPIE